MLSYTRCVCGRTALMEGAINSVEASWDRYGEEPAVRGLVELRDSRSQKKRERYDNLAYRIVRYARDGHLKVPRELNRLSEQIEELKTSDDRLLFFRLEEEPGLKGRRVRLTHLYKKGTQRAPRGEIARAEAIAREDARRESGSCG